MKRMKKLWLCSALAFTVGIVGCNLFNPTESVDINTDDVDALTYEGYIYFRKAEYTQAREYFEKALAVDSAASEAWYGLAKSVLNQQKLNVFEMLKYANSKTGGVSGFMNMDDSTANHYKSGIDSVMKIVDPFIERDTTGRTDKKVTFKTISASYTVLQLTKAALLLRSSSNDITKMFQVTTDPISINIDWSSMKEMGEEAVDMFTTLGDVGHAIATDPSIATEVLRSYVPEAEYLSDEGLTAATEAMADYMIAASEAVTSNEESILAFTSMGDFIDLDGDGCIDEEIADNYDNDGDGLVDEDMRPNGVMVFEKDIVHHKIGQVASVTPNEEYLLYDLDKDGEPGDAREWSFLVDGSNDRDAQGEHRFVAFAALQWSVSTEITLHDALSMVRHDTDVNNIQYNLDWRKAYIGGCWNNYDEDMFLKWFEGRD